MLSSEQIQQQVEEYLKQGKPVTVLASTERAIKNPNRGFSLSFQGQQERVRVEREQQR